MVETDDDEYEGVPYQPLYHGIRTKKTEDQIKKEGFCTFATKVDMKREIVLALKYFGKEKLLTVTPSGGRFGRVRRYVEQAESKTRRNIWASTDKEAACRWWSQANPEIISWMLHDIEIPPEKIDKYLSERFGSNCYNIKLKITSRGHSADFNTGLDCMPPNLIEKIEECECKYTGKEHTLKKR